MLILTQGSNSSGMKCVSKLDDAVSIKPELEDFWKLEALGITDMPERSDDYAAIANFKETIKFEDGRYAVTWPWRNEFPDLSENRGMALGRLRSLSGKLRKQPDLLQRYDNNIRDQCEKGIIEKVDRNQADGMKHYIPHHVVVKPDNSTTELRVVYDASAKTRKEHKSLNENL
ncbi:uncharacterized protein LOC128558656 [Mercenaria mercenaria]|uniref:uncharacterized protein LOC128558656 n=1 Tax=Mercenaria mercenaria TaxID=6596 RepID=UPI00234EE0F9|nr:uncharacterized protein LOC128558656 [Mercenaria mercenaria]